MTINNASDAMQEDGGRCFSCKLANRPAAPPAGAPIWESCTRPFPVWPRTLGPPRMRSSTASNMRASWPPGSKSTASALLAGLVLLLVPSAAAAQVHTVIPTECSPYMLFQSYGEQAGPAPPAAARSLADYPPASFRILHLLSLPSTQASTSLTGALSSQGPSPASCAAPKQHWTNCQRRSWP